VTVRASIGADQGPPMTFALIVEGPLGKRAIAAVRSIF
jgi:hypothetical protein